MNNDEREKKKSNKTNRFFAKDCIGTKTNHLQQFIFTNTFVLLHKTTLLNHSRLHNTTGMRQLSCETKARSYIQIQFAFGAFDNFLFNRVFSDHAIHSDWFRLPNTMSTILCLQIHLRIPFMLSV